MALLLIEGFDHLTAAQVTLKGWGGSTTFGAMSTGRFGGQCYVVKVPGGGVVDKSFTASTTVTLGAAVNFNTSLNAGANPGNFALTLYSGGGSTLQAYLQCNGSNVLEVRNNANSLIATGTTALVINVWYYVELKIVVNGASGSCAVQLNGASEIATTTGNFGSSSLNLLGLYSRGDSKEQPFDDVYLCDGTGADNKTFLGDVRVQTVWPNGDGSHLQWTPTGGGAHYTQVNETTPDGDTTYVADNTPGHLDTYNFTDVDGAASVYGTQLNLYARKDDANTRQIAPVIRQGGTDYIGTTATLSSSYLFYSQLYDKDPTAAAWTAANVNSDEMGVKEIA